MRDRNKRGGGGLARSTAGVGVREDYIINGASIHNMFIDRVIVYDIYSKLRGDNCNICSRTRIPLTAASAG